MESSNDSHQFTWLSRTLAIVLASTLVSTTLKNQRNSKSILWLDADAHQSVGVHENNAAHSQRQQAARQRCNTQSSLSLSLSLSKLRGRGATHSHLSLSLSLSQSVARPFEESKKEKNGEGKRKRRKEEKEETKQKECVKTEHGRYEDARCAKKRA